MSEHGWDHHDDLVPPDPEPGPPGGDDAAAQMFAGYHDDDGWDVPPAAEPWPGPPADPPQPPEPATTAEPGAATVAGEPGAAAVAGEPVGADPDALTEPGDRPPVFPPALDVGPLPEPVDGFPWIDTASLGVADIAAAAPPGSPTAQDLAAYAAADLPDAADPWDALAASDDPATAALARFYRPGEPGPGA